MSTSTSDTEIVVAYFSKGPLTFSLRGSRVYEIIAIAFDLHTSYSFRTESRSSELVTLAKSRTELADFATFAYRRDEPTLRSPRENMRVDL